MPSKKNCVSRLRKKYKDVDKAVLEKIVDDIDSFQSSKRRLEVDPRKTLDEFMEEYSFKLAVQRKSLSDNIVKSKVVFSKAILDAFKDDPVEAMLAIMGGTIRKVPGLGSSIDTVGKSIELKYGNMLIQGLEEAGLWKVAMSGNIEKEIMQEMWELRPGGKPGSTKSKEAMKIATILHKVQDGLIGTLQASGSTVRYLEGHIMRQTHDNVKVYKAGKEAWKAKIRQHGLDEQRTFGEAAGNVELEELILDEAFEQISTDSWNLGVGQFIDDSLATIRDPLQLEKRISKSRAIHFKDGYSLYNYNQEFGKQDLMSSVHSAIIKTSRNAALIDAFGTNPTNGFLNLFTKLKRHYKDNPDVVRKMDESYDRIRGLFLELRGDTKRAGTSKAARYSKIFMAVERMRLLGRALITTMGDIPASAVTLRSRTGENIFSAHFKVINDFLTGIPETSRRQEIGKRLNVMVTDLLGSHYNKFDSSDGVPGQLGKLQRIYFRMNGLTYQSIWGKSSAAATIAGEMGDNAHKAFGDLGDWHKQGLSQYGIFEKEWDLIRQATEDVGGIKMVTSEAIDELSDDAFKAYRGDRKISLKALRNEVWNKYQGYITDYVDDAIVTPGAREQSAFLRGTPEDSLWGVVSRMVSQFKTVPLSIARIHGKASFGSPFAESNTWRDLWQWDTLTRLNKKTDMQNFVGFLTSATIIGYYGLVADDLVKGKNPRSPWDAETWKDAFIKGGAGGLVFDFLLADYDDTHRNLIADFAGPVPGTLAEAASILASVRDIGQEGRKVKDVFGDATRFLGSRFPGQNHLFTRLPLDYIILHDINEYLNNGYSRKLKNKVKGEQGYWDINGFSPGDPTERLGR